MMNQKNLICIAVFLQVIGFSGISFGDPDLPKKKQTTLGLYVTAEEAFQQWRENSQSVVIIDCRTPEEYVFVRHASMAYNIPSQFMTHAFDEKKYKPVMKNNPDFVALVKAKFKPTDTIMIMCRSGGRSTQAANILAKEGFTKVYNITDGFEGDMVKDPDSAYNEKRLKNGWRNSGNPWTYKFDQKLVYVSSVK